MQAQITGLEEDLQDPLVEDMEESVEVVGVHHTIPVHQWEEDEEGRRLASWPSLVMASALTKKA